MKEEKIPRCIQVFEQSVNSKVTRKNYRQRLDAFMEFAKIGDYEALVKIDPHLLQTHLENYVMLLKRRHEKGDFRSRSFNAYLAAIEAFFVQNDIVLNFKKVKRWIPKYEKLSGEEPYSNDDIKKMLAVANIRWKAIIHFFASTGARPEGVFYLKKKHLRPIGNGCTVVTIYENENEEYFGFLTSEATKALTTYFDKRQFDGEKITGESPVFRNAYRETQGWRNIKQIKNGTAYSSFAQLLSKAGLRKIKKGDNKIRHSKRIFYGFRKRYNTTLKDNIDVNPNTAEKLMGHKNGLDGVYYNPTIQKRFKEFCKAIRDLTVDDSERKQVLLDVALKEKSELSKGFTILKSRQRRTDDKVERMLRGMAAINPKYSKILEIRKKGPY